MKIHVLGCGDAFGSGGRRQSAYLVEARERLFLLDCGPSALAALKGAGFAPRDLEAIFVSHLHGDHCAGLVFFLLDWLYESPRAEPLVIAGPPGLQERIARLMALMFGDGGAPRPLPPADFRELEPERPVTLAGVELFAFRVPHQVRDLSFALKVSCDGKTLLYSGDSPWTERFVGESQGADLFLCECTYYEPGAANHLSYREIRANLPRLGCRRLLLTHLGREMLERRGEIELPVAEDGAVIEI
jgi:ribonuclease BN (tRNA processing enzyme)